MTMVFDFAKIVKVEGNMKSGVAQFLLPKCNGLMWKIDGGLCFVYHHATVTEMLR